MYRDPPALPALERSPAQMLEQLGVLEPGEQSQVGPVERVRATAARVRVAYDIAGEPVGAQDEVVVDVPGAPEAVARHLGRSQCVVEREVSERELDTLPRHIRRAGLPMALFYLGIGILEVVVMLLLVYAAAGVCR